MTADTITIDRIREIETTIGEVAGILATIREQSEEGTMSPAHAAAGITLLVRAIQAAAR